MLIESQYAIPTLDDLLAAQNRLAREAVLTPLLESERLNRQLGGRLLVKAECLQKTGSFKFRGAYNFISTLTDAERQQGVVAYSSGNHAQGVALAAKLLETPAIIVMPADAPQTKLEATRDYGAQVVTYNRRTESREAIARSIQAEKGGTLVPPFEHPLIIAGQASAALELADQAQALSTSLDALLVPCSGGGLAAGCALALAHRMPQTKVIVVEPQGYDDTRQSLEAGKPVTISPDQITLCDALAITSPGAFTFSINRTRIQQGLAVSDAEVLAAMACAFDQFKLVLEPGGAAALAAILAGKYPIAGQTVAVIASGGNVDRECFMQALLQAGLN